MNVKELDWPLVITLNSALIFTTNWATFLQPNSRQFYYYVKGLKSFQWEQIFNRAVADFRITRLKWEADSKNLELIKNAIGRQIAFDGMSQFDAESRLETLKKSIRDILSLGESA